MRKQKIRKKKEPEFDRRRYGEDEIPGVLDVENLEQCLEAQANLYIALAGNISKEERTGVFEPSF